jgi:hypothetical protein
MSHEVICAVSFVQINIEEEKGVEKFISFFYGDLQNTLIRDANHRGW